MRPPPAPGALPGVAPVLRDLTARRLARSYITHLLVTLVALGELLLVADTGWSRAVTLVAGAAGSGGGLLLMGWAGVRRGAGAVEAGWLRWAGVAAVVPWAFGLFVFGVAGLRGLALASGSPVRLAAGVLYAVLGLRILRDSVRVREVGQLARFMSVPAPEETAG